MTAEDALVELGRRLLASGYRFTTITPESHRRVVARARTATSLTDVFGWSRSFAPDVLPRDLRTLLERADALVEEGRALRSTVRFSSLDDRVYVHSAYPTSQADAVFFGPDSYRFVRFLRGAIDRAGVLVDVGAGSGVGGLALADRAQRIVLADINDRALSFCRVNAAIAGLAERVEVVHSDVLAGVRRQPDVIVSNPPYLVDAAHRTYRDGGTLGIALALRIVDEAMQRLAVGGRLALYTGAPVIEGRDCLREALRVEPTSYEELDPDVFGEELDTPAYASVDRIAAVGLVATKR